MIRNILAARGLVAMNVAAAVGTCGLYEHPVQMDNPFLGLIALENPPVFRVLAYGYATLWFTTTLSAAPLGLSVLAIATSRAPRTRAPTAAAVLSRSGVLLYADPCARRSTSRAYGYAANPTRLTIQQRGLYGGVTIFGAVGTAKRPSQLGDRTRPRDCAQTPDRSSRSFPGNLFLIDLYPENAEGFDFPFEDCQPRR